MTLRALRAVLTATLHKVDHLVAFDLVDHVSLNSRAFNHRRTDGGTHHQNFVELNFFTSISSKFLNAKHIARLNPILLAAGFHDREHGLFLFSSASSGPGFTGVLAIAASNSAPIGRRSNIKSGPKTRRELAYGSIWGSSQGIYCQFQAHLGNGASASSGCTYP